MSPESTPEASKSQQIEVKAEEQVVPGSTSTWKSAIEAGKVLYNEQAASLEVPQLSDFQIADEPTEFFEDGKFIVGVWDLSLSYADGTTNKFHFMGVSLNGPQNLIEIMLPLSIKEDAVLSNYQLKGDRTPVLSIADIAEASTEIQIVNPLSLINAISNMYKRSNLYRQASTFKNEKAAEIFANIVRDAEPFFNRNVKNRVISPLTIVASLQEGAADLCHVGYYYGRTDTPKKLPNIRRPDNAD